MNDFSRYTEQYYSEQGLDRDRIALWYYARVLRHLCPGGGRVLDYGCGTGWLLRRLSRSFESYGYDPSSAARSLCRVNAPDATVLENFETVPDGSLDAVVTLHTLEHVRRPSQLIGKLVQRLDERGVLLIVVPNTGGIGRRLKGAAWFANRDPTHCSLLSPGEWATILRRSRLDLLWIRGDGMWDAPYVSFVPASVQRAIFGAPAGAQLLFPIARPFLPAKFGECLIIAARKRTE